MPRIKKTGAPRKAPVTPKKKSFKTQINELKEQKIIPEFPIVLEDKKKTVREVAFDLFMAGESINDIAKTIKMCRNSVYNFSREDKWEERLAAHCDEARRVLSRMTPDEMEKYVPRIIDWIKILNTLMNRGYEFFKGDEAGKEKPVKNPFESSGEAINGLKFVSSEFQRLGFFAPEIIRIKTESKIEAKATVDINLITKDDMNLLWECYEYAPTDKEAPAITIIEQESAN